MMHGPQNVKFTNKILLGYLYINEISLSQLIGLYRRVIGVFIDVVCVVDFAEKGMREYSSWL